MTTDLSPQPRQILRPVLVTIALAVVLVLGATVVLGVEASSGADPVTPAGDLAAPSDPGPRVEYETLAVVEAARVQAEEAVRIGAYFEAVAQAEAQEAARVQAEQAARERADAQPVAAQGGQTPAQAPEPVPTYAAGSIEDMICATFGSQCAAALRVVQCESTFNPGTIGAAGERGLFQIHPVHIPYLNDRGMSWDAMFDPAANIAYAYDLYSRSGWGPWTCKP